MIYDRGSGILMHISSLPSDYGIGTLGKKARDFADFLEQTKQKYWQILPVGPTGYGDSPYQSFSSFAGNPYFIDIDYLIEEGLLTKEEVENIVFVEDESNVNFSRIYIERKQLFKLAFERFDINTDDFIKFTKEKAYWLEDYALFMSIKESFGGVKWLEWPNEYKNRNSKTLKEFAIKHERMINYQKFVQYQFFMQWKSFKKYVNDKNIMIIGDIPIYVAEDSCDIWANPNLFQLNDDKTLKFVGGCPPDKFSDSGQLWGNPVYDWNKIKESEFDWWIKRIEANFELFDFLRIDHFRGLASYWRIPSDSKNAVNGEWIKGPGIELFEALKKNCGKLNIIAEDLGYMTSEVYELREKTGFPNMKVLEFAFDSDYSNDHLPHNYDSNCVVYIGTHDNDTIKGWLENINEKTFDFAKKYLNLEGKENLPWELIRLAMGSVAKISIIQMQDLLNLDNSARMNNPGKSGENWKWRMKENSISSKLSDKLRNLTEITGRANN